MPRAKTTTATGVNKELIEQTITLQRKLDAARAKSDEILQSISGLRTHIVQNSVDEQEILRLLERIITES